LFVHRRGGWVAGRIEASRENLNVFSRIFRMALNGRKFEFGSYELSSDFAGERTACRKHAIGDGKCHSLGFIGSLA
jgi:hypothetical protein